MPRPDSFTSEVLTLETERGVATLWLDRPEKRNALGPAFWADLPRAMETIGADPDLRVVVVAAKGPHFTVGLDLVAMAGVLAGGSDSGSADGSSGRQPSMAARARTARTQILRMQQSVTSVADCPLPVIAAISGYCIGGGVDLAAACDIRLASRDAILSVREAKLAIVADLGSLQRLPSIIGRGHVAELGFTGMDITAERAAAIGLVNRVSADPEAVLADARDLAADIAANSPLAVQGTKAVLVAGETRSVSEGLDYVATWNAGALASDDLREAMVAFAEKRPPVFTGR
ncbi:MAG: crotonase/enoyl-CoA hydratase family protein [Acidimicrobiales bacterium]